MNKVNPHISVDCVVFGFDFTELKVLLIERKYLSLENMQSQGLLNHDLKLPGDLIQDNETLNSSARRILEELTGIKNIYLKQFNVFDSPNRVKETKDKNWLEETKKINVERIVSVAFYSLIRFDETNQFQMMIKNKAKWIPLSELGELAFDHNDIVQKALNALRNELKTEPVAFELLPELFTINQLQKLYEVILGVKIDNRNFRKKVYSQPYIKATDKKETGVAHKPAKYYTFDRKKYQTYQKHNMVYAI